MANDLLPFEDKLPVELQEKIFGYLGSDMVLESRLVCKNWKTFVDDNDMEAKIWKPHFSENHEADNLSYFTGTRNRTGTFISSKQIEEIMKGEYARIGPLKEEDSKQVDAICRTLILQFRSVDEYTNLWQFLLAFVVRFGYFIRHLVYFVHMEVPESVTNLPLIFTQMKNIQSLIIFCQDWGYVKHLLNVGVQLPNEVKSLTILGNRSHLFLPYILASRCPHVKRLKLCSHSGGEDVNEMTSVFSYGVRSFPDVEELKLCNVSYSGLLGLCTWPIKRLSVKMAIEAPCRYLLLVNILEAVEKFAGTLECFHMQFLEKQMIGLATHGRNIAFPKVHDLRVPYFAGSSWEYLMEFARIFPNMKHLQLVDNENEVVDDDEVVEQFVRQLWEYLPPDGLEMISVRYRDYYNNNRGVVGGENAARRYSYITQKYFQERPV